MEISIGFTNQVITRWFRSLQNITMFESGGTPAMGLIASGC